jgi:hypothetical protein
MRLVSAATFSLPTAASRRPCRVDHGDAVGVADHQVAGVDADATDRDRVVQAAGDELGRAVRVEAGAYIGRPSSRIATLSRTAPSMTTGDHAERHALLAHDLAISALDRSPLPSTMITSQAWRSPSRVNHQVVAGADFDGQCRGRRTSSSATAAPSVRSAHRATGDVGQDRGRVLRGLFDDLRIDAFEFAGSRRNAAA